MISSKCRSLYAVPSRRPQHPLFSNTPTSYELVKLEYSSHRYIFIFGCYYPQEYLLIHQWSSPPASPHQRLITHLRHAVVLISSSNHLWCLLSWILGNKQQNASALAARSVGRFTQVVHILAPENQHIDMENTSFSTLQIVPWLS
jgi:hypothetical protein